MKRLTFALFRLYTAAVSGGIGSVFGWCLGWWILVKGLGVYGWLLWGVGMLVLVSGFAVVAYKGARGLRGTGRRRTSPGSPKRSLRGCRLRIDHGDSWPEQFTENDFAGDDKA